MRSRFEDVLEALSGRTSRNQAAKAVAGLGIGLAIGALAGLLFAPKSGRETRQDVRDAAEKGARIVKEKAGTGAGFVSESAHDFARIAKDTAGTLKQKVAAGAGTVADKVDRLVHRADKQAAGSAGDFSDRTDEPEPIDLSEVPDMVDRSGQNESNIIATTSPNDPHIEAAEFNRR